MMELFQLVLLQISIGRVYTVSKYAPPVEIQLSVYSTTQLWVPLPAAIPKSQQISLLPISKNIIHEHKVFLMLIR